jgi:hypothetical protein
MIENVTKTRNIVKLWLALLAIIILGAGCGSYRLGSSLPDNLQTIYIHTFKNLTYQPGIEVDITNAIITRFRRDGTLRPVKENEADTILEGEITNWERRVMTYTGEQSNIPQEYRLYVTAVINFTDRSTGEPLVTRQQIRGYTDFYVEGDLPDAEQAAQPAAFRDLARRIVDNVIAIW